MPIYSTITIEFLVDFNEGYELRMGTLENEVLTAYSFDWVTTRSGAFEVTTGTPTGNAGETTATNFESAYDLDFPTDFVTTRTVNSLLIESETEGLDFSRFAVLDDNGDFLTKDIDYNVTYNNYVAPVDYSNIEFALVKSPHYVNIPFISDTTTSTTVNLYVWDGALSPVPTTATNTLTIPRPTTDFAEFNVDLSELIAQRLNPIPVIDLTTDVQVVDSTDDSVKWVQYTASYTDASESIADIEGTFLGVDGYGYYNEGVNPTKPSNNILTNCFNRKVDRNGFIMLPFVNNGTILTIDVLSETGEIDQTMTITPSDNSTDMVQYIEVDLTASTTDEYITITTKPASDVVTYEIVDECRYSPIQVIFKNKYGVYENLTLFKKSNNSINVSSDKFINNYVASGVYDTTKHQHQKINITGKKKITSNSGYIKETENTLYQEMLLSETVFFYENDALVPVNVSTSSLEYKTRVNDKLVNYTIEFDYAYNLIQNV